MRIQATPNVQRRVQIKQLAWPMTERKIEHRKSCLVLSASFLVVNGRSCPVAKSAYCIQSHLRFKNTNDNWFEYDSTITIVYDFSVIAFILKHSTVEA